MEVILLVTPGCSGCLKVENYLDEMKIGYRVIDVTKDPAILQKYPIMAAPGIVINGKLEFIGAPGKDELKKMLGTKR